MQESPDINVSWGRAAFFAGLFLTVVTILTKLKAIGKLLSKFGAWLGRKIILSLLNSDSKETRDAIAEWFAAELTEGLKTRKLVGQLEDQVVMTQEDIRAFREEMETQRKETRSDIQHATYKMENRMRDFEVAIRKSNEETNQNLRAVNDTLHLVLGVVTGPEGTKEELRKRRDQMRDD